MATELQLWQFISDRIRHGQTVLLLVVAESSGSSPGRAGYKMAVATDGELCGSIGGGLMEVTLVEQSRALLSEPAATRSGDSSIKEQVHQRNNPNSSGMICSGKQTVLFRLLSPENADAVSTIVKALENQTLRYLSLTPDRFGIEEKASADADYYFGKKSETDFTYCERLGPKNELFIVGGGHCALALSELMSRLDFRISIFDDRPELNTLAKNNFADRITIIGSYEKVAEHIPSGANIYVVVMTLGFKSDETVIRSLFEKTFKYFGILGSKAKMKTLLSTLEKDGFSKERLSQIHTPIGLPINSHTPEEIAISIAAEIISIKNS